MANSNGGRTCPKCGMNLGQRHLCPVCDQPEENTKSASNPAADAGGNAAPAFWQEKEYVSKVIGFVEKHRDDWDDEFNAFFDGLGEKPDYDECFEACSQVNDILKTDMSSGKISGSMTRQTMGKLRDVFPELTSEEARELAMHLLHKRLDSFFAPPSPGSDPEVMDLYRRAMEQNDADAQNRLGYAYDYGKGVNEDKPEAVRWYRKAAEQGYASAQYNLGYAYAHGEGVSEDRAEAVRWYRKAAEQGHATAQYNLGYAYDYGKGVNEDKAEAVKWYRKAAEQGYASAQNNLGYAYAHGEGVSEDKAEAVKWYRKAAEQDNASAQYNLGYAYDYGKGVNEDKAEAVKWYRKAAEQGNASAQYNLGYCYDFGEGVSEDKEEAEKWYRKAAEQGHEKARLWMKKLKL